MDAMADVRIEQALRGLERALDVLDRVRVAPADGREALDLVRRVERVARRVWSCQAALSGELHHRSLYRDDGHRSAKAMLAFAANLPGAEAGRRANDGAMLRRLPAVAAGLRSGEIGRAQVERIGRVHRNPRVREQLEAVDADLAVAAARLPYDEFDAMLTRWEYLADEDGAGGRAERNHRRRSFSIRQNLDGSYRIEGGCGSLQGTVTAEVLEAYVRAELEADWAAARAEHGEQATVEDLARTDAQRRMDALERIFLDAASALHEREGHRIVTDLVIDQETFERAVRRLAGDHPGPDPRLATWWKDLAAAAPPVGMDERGVEVLPDGPGGTPPRPVEVWGSWRSMTLDGRFVHPVEVAAVTLVGRIRRVVFGGDGVVVDMGRTRRLFTGAGRLAVALSNPTCYWPGCQRPVQACEADHLQRWSEGGPTNAANGAPACGSHNRFRNHGFRVARAPDGTLVVHRPDGSRLE